jgi:hypothetical protein
VNTTDRSGCPAPTHGTAPDYGNHGCRCADARESWRIYRKRLREGRHVPHLVDATGVTRRMRSLVASGYRQADLARDLGVSKNRANQLCWMHKATVTRTTDQAVRALFRRLDGTRGGSKYAATTAKRNGWVDAAAFDNIDDPAEQPKLGNPDADVVDEVLVCRVLDGERADLSPANRLHAVALGRQRGLPLSVIGARLHVSHTTARGIEQQLAHAA